MLLFQTDNWAGDSEGFLGDFLSENKAEVIAVSILLLLSDLGRVSKELKEK